MFALFKVLKAFETLLFAIPETVGMLAFGIGLVFLAVFIRWFMARGETQKNDQRSGKLVD